MPQLCTVVLSEFVVTICVYLAPDLLRHAVSSWTAPGTDHQTHSASEEGLIGAVFYEISNK